MSKVNRWAEMLKEGGKRGKSSKEALREETVMKTITLANGEEVTVPVTTFKEKPRKAQPTVGCKASKRGGGAGGMKSYVQEEVIEEQKQKALKGA